MRCLLLVGDSCLKRAPSIPPTVPSAAEHREAAKRPEEKTRLSEFPSAVSHGADGLRSCNNNVCQ